GGPEEAERAHLVEDLAVELLVEEGLAHARQELLLAIVARAVAHHALFLGELVFEEERIVPLERGLEIVGFHAAILVRGALECRGPSTLPRHEEKTDHGRRPLEDRASRTADALSRRRAGLRFRYRVRHEGEQGALEPLDPLVLRRRAA